MKKQIQSTRKNALNETALFKEIRDLILSARKAVARNVNSVQVITNFEIGRRIVEHEQKGEIRAVYGAVLLKELSSRLGKEFGRGFSRANLQNIRNFYLLYRLPEKCQMPSGKLAKTRESRMPFKLSLSWSQYVFLTGIKDENARKFYEIEAANNNWGLPELTRQFNSGLYERLALSRDKEGIRRLAKEGQVVTKPEELLKEPLVLEFLGLDESAKYSESDLETAIIDKIGQFLLELGKGFLFEARQKRFTFDEDHFFVDLVFYNRLLKCYVLIDLKIGKLTHQDLGQMQMYVNYFDRYVRTKGESATIGIILCREKHDALVKITLPKDANVHAKEYRLYLPSKEELQQKLMEWNTKVDLTQSFDRRNYVQM